MKGDLIDWETIKKGDGTKNFQKEFDISYLELFAKLLILFILCFFFYLFSIFTGRA